MNAAAISLIARRELSGYLRTMSGYLVIAGLLFVDGLFFNLWGLGGADKRSAEVLSQFFYTSSGVTMVAAVLLSMRLLAEERQSGTLPLLYSSPVRDGEIVLGKFLAALVFLGLFLLCTVFMPALVLVNGKVSWGHVTAGYLGLLLIGAASLGLGTLGSALAKNQLLAGVASGCILLTLLLCWLLASRTDRPLSQIFTAMALHGDHFRPFQAGVVHLRDIAYYVAVTYFTLFAATRVLEARRWR